MSISSVIYDIDRNILNSIPAVSDKISFITALYGNKCDSSIAKVRDILCEHIGYAIDPVLKHYIDGDFESMNAKLKCWDFIMYKIKHIPSLFNKYESVCYRKILSHLPKKCALLYTFWKSDCWALEGAEWNDTKVEPTTNFIEYLFYMSFYKYFAEKQNWDVLMDNTVEYITFKQVTLENIDYVMNLFDEHCLYRTWYTTYLEFHRKI